MKSIDGVKLVAAFSIMLWIFLQLYERVSAYVVAFINVPH